MQWGGYDERVVFQGLFRAIIVALQRIGQVLNVIVDRFLSGIPCVVVEIDARERRSDFRARSTAGVTAISPRPTPARESAVISMRAVFVKRSRRSMAVATRDTSSISAVRSSTDAASNLCAFRCADVRIILLLVEMDPVKPCSCVLELALHFFHRGADGFLQRLVMRCGGGGLLRGVVACVAESFGSVAIAIET